MTHMNVGNAVRRRDRLLPGDPTRANAAIFGDYRTKSLTAQASRASSPLQVLHFLPLARVATRNWYIAFWGYSKCTASPTKPQLINTSITPRLKRNNATAAAKAISAEGQSKVPLKPFGQST